MGLAIACATDEGYAPHCAAMLHSLLLHNPAGIEVSILHGGDLSRLTRERLEHVARAGNADARLIEVGPELLQGFPDRRFHISCWYRVLLPVLRPDLRRILYLDSDAIVLADLQPLWNTDLRGRQFGAVVNPLYPFMPDRPALLGLERAEYLNSGVLLMDLERMRATRTPELLRAYACRHPDNIWPEQDALSVVCRGDWTALDPRWNAQTTLFDLAPSQLPFTRAQVEEARARPAFVHFIGPHKPWHYLCRHPMRQLYARHRDATPWRGFELEGRTLRNRLLRPLSLAAQVRLREAYRAAIGRWRHGRRP